ncbi:MAG: prolyl oligopeptidase family serine peptidase [Candidatus Latescibacteria bacterium]|nr:prolyl oligopeptidase family serine peptidase [bacterium]MBD3423573.1 prolyl oligopeptidase family serine peptidase [Candidatus Latescibacterota bacterium]
MRNSPAVPICPSGRPAPGFLWNIFPPATIIVADRKDLMKGAASMSILKSSVLSFLCVLLIAAILSPPGLSSEKVPVSPEDATRIKRSYNARISPDGSLIAYTVYSQREAGDEPGSGYRELYLVSTETGEVRPFITGKVNVSSPRFSPEGSRLAFLMKRGEGAKRQVWMIPVDGGESVPVTDFDTGVYMFRWHPSGDSIAFVATEPKSETEEELEEKGYRFIYFEENLKDRNIHICEAALGGDPAEPRQITEDKVVWDFQFSPGGKRIAAAISPMNLVDHQYMFKDIHLVDMETGEVEALTDHSGKLGNFAFSPDGGRIAYAASLELKDHAVSQAYLVDAGGGEPVNLTPTGFRGHITSVGWKDRKTVAYTAAEGVWNTLNTVRTDGKRRTRVLDGKEIGLVFRTPDYTDDFKHFALVCSSPGIPGDIFYWKYGEDRPERMTEFNPWIEERKLGKQEVIRYQARDGLEIEGILVYPVDYDSKEKYPLIVSVHGGPESHYTNGWLGSYFNPGHVLAGKGYLAFYPNYRASTGYGTEFALEGYEDAAGREFDDIADGIDFLAEKGLADRERVGLGGGSYGGFASAWFASYYTEYVNAVCMFVGISDLVSKRGTTDIPWEELYVHSGRKLDASWDMWEFSIKRSPIYYARQSETAVLILGGTADTRVHPSQSLEFYRRLKMNDHPAVRLVRYPGEGHGNRKQPGRIDVLHRHLQWYDWYVMDNNPLDGPMPPLLIEDDYGLELDEKE